MASIGKYEKVEFRIGVLLFFCILLYNKMLLKIAYEKGRIGVCLQM